MSVVLREQATAKRRVTGEFGPLSRAFFWRDVTFDSFLARMS